MKFEQALKAMKQGVKVKLPSWGGYWCWNPEKETVMMHCRVQDTDKGQEPVLDIRETQRVEYTLQNILSDEWVIADESNTPVLGGEATFNFGDAIKYLKRGLKVARKGWNLLPWIGLKTANGKFVPWQASQTDMLADDWVFVD